MTDTIVRGPGPGVRPRPAPGPRPRSIREVCLVGSPGRRYVHLAGVEGTRPEVRDLLVETRIVGPEPKAV